MRLDLTRFRDFAPIGRGAVVDVHSAIADFGGGADRSLREADSCGAGRLLRDAHVRRSASRLARPVASRRALPCVRRDRSRLRVRRRSCPRIEPTDDPRGIHASRGACAGRRRVPPRERGRPRPRGGSLDRVARTGAHAPRSLARCGSRRGRRSRRAVGVLDGLDVPARRRAASAHERGARALSFAGTLHSAGCRADGRRLFARCDALRDARGPSTEAHSRSTRGCPTEPRGTWRSTGRTFHARSPISSRHV